MPDTLPELPEPLFLLHTGSRSETSATIGRLRPAAKRQSMRCAKPRRLG